MKFEEYVDAISREVLDKHTYYENDKLTIEAYF